MYPLKEYPGVWVEEHTLGVGGGLTVSQALGDSENICAGAEQPICVILQMTTQRTTVADKQPVLSGILSF